MLQYLCPTGTHKCALQEQTVLLHSDAPRCQYQPNSRCQGLTLWLLGRRIDVMESSLCAWTRSIDLARTSFLSSWNTPASRGMQHTHAGKALPCIQHTPAALACGLACTHMVSTRSTHAGKALPCMQYTPAALVCGLACTHMVSTRSTHAGNTSCDHSTDDCAP